jgi:hypothetical protein
VKLKIYRYSQQRLFILLIKIRHHYHHNFLHELGHAWSVPSSWRVCWPFHLNFERPVSSFFGFMFEFSSESVCLPFVARDSSIVICFQNVIIRLNMFSSFLILVFPIWSLLVLYATLLKNSISTVPILVSSLFFII